MHEEALSDLLVRPLWTQGYGKNNHMAMVSIVNGGVSNRRTAYYSADAEFLLSTVYDYCLWIS